jgi:alkylresorcinol/alkylpyrone synthase
MPFMAAALMPTAVALPEHAYSQAEIGEVISAVLADHPEKAAKAKSILANSQVERRHVVRPLEWYLEHVSVTERSAVYQEEMVALCERAARAALEGAGVEPASVGLIVTTSCTGIMIPAVESHLMNRIPFSPNARRMPLTELGCAGGAAALGQADIFLRAHPESAALVLAAELSSLTAQMEDFSMANIVSASLFGDGAAATLLVGERFAFPADGAGAAAPGAARNAAGPGGGPEQRPAPRIVATRSVWFPDTLDLMGFENTDTGLKIFLAPRVPRFLRQNLPRHVAPFLAEHGLRVSDVSHFLLHPGGPKVIAGLEEEFGLSREQTRLSHEVLRRYGNLSSATVLFLLNLFEQEERPLPGDHGLLLAVGPGFCAEMVLLQW